MLSQSQKRARKKADREDRQRRCRAKIEAELMRRVKNAATCITAHEAAHAIVALALSLPIEYVRIESTQLSYGGLEYFTGGHISLTRSPDVTTPNPENATALLTCVVAGHVGESMVASSCPTRPLASEQLRMGEAYTGSEEAPKGNQDDLKMAKELVALATGGRASTDETIANLVVDAEDEARKVLRDNVDAWNRLREALVRSRGQQMRASEMAENVGPLVVPEGLKFRPSHLAKSPADADAA